MENATMTLKDLRVFTVVVEARSLGAAARHLGYTQPAVSQHLSRLERECDMPLLERSVKGITLTPAGQVLYEASSSGLAALSLAMREIQRLRDGDTGRLSIATGGTTVRHFLREAIVHFRERHPAVTLHFEPASSTPRCLEAVVQRRVDLAFVTITDNPPGFEQRPVLENALMLLVRCDDPLAARRRASLRDLHMIRYISLPESTTSHGYIRDQLVKEGVHLMPTARVDDFDTANVFVELGLGHAIVPAVQGYHFEQAHRVKAIPIHGMPPIRIGWAARQFRLLPPVAQDFMAIFADTARQWKDIPGLKVLQSDRV
jgi:DNA-binding transcriptional LysR family regulator